MAYTKDIVFNEDNFFTQKDNLLQKLDSMTNSLDQINSYLAALVGSDAWNETEGYAVSMGKAMNEQLLKNADNIAAVRENINQYLVTISTNYYSI